MPLTIQCSHPQTEINTGIMTQECQPSLSVQTWEKSVDQIESKMQPSQAQHTTLQTHTAHKWRQYMRTCMHLSLLVPMSYVSSSVALCVPHRTRIHRTREHTVQQDHRIHSTAGPENTQYSRTREHIVQQDQRTHSTAGPENT